MVHAAAREQAPGSDLVSLVVHARVGERGLTADEEIGMVTLLFLARLDTVAAMLSFIMAFLGRNPQHYARLVGDAALIPNAAEELMRVHGVAGTERGVRRLVVWSSGPVLTPDPAAIPAGQP